MNSLRHEVRLHRSTWQSLSPLQGTGRENNHGRTRVLVEYAMISLKYGAVEAVTRPFLGCLQLQESVRRQFLICLLNSNRSEKFYLTHIWVQLQTVKLLDCGSELAPRRQGPHTYVSYHLAPSV